MHHIDVSVRLNRLPYKAKYEKKTSSGSDSKADMWRIVAVSHTAAYAESFPSLSRGAKSYKK